MVEKLYKELQEEDEDQSMLHDLIPFYCSFGRKNYQCFYLKWVPLNQVGNVWYSPGRGKIAELGGMETWVEHLAFPTFLDWLMFYLETLEEV